MREALARWEPITVEVINYRKDGSEFWNEFSLVPVADQKGWYTHWIAVQRDTTARKRADEVRLALEREKELSALKIRFFSMASHEFRTPLSTVLAAAQVLETLNPYGTTLKNDCEIYTEFKIPLKTWCSCWRTF